MAAVTFRLCEGHAEQGEADLRRFGVAVEVGFPCRWCRRAESDKLARPTVI